MNKCEHEEECVVRKRYRELCFQNMTEQEKSSLGNSCPVSDEYQNVPEDYLVCPTGIIRKLMHGDTIRGERL